MSYVSGRRGLRVAGLLALGIAAAAAIAAPAAADVVKVRIDQSQVIRLPERAATVVIGNPLIADATLQNGGMLVLTGKGYGATNLVALDRAGRTVRSDMIEVVGPGTPDLVTVYRGADRETWSCAPKCEPRITLGDGTAFFAATIGQTGMRNGQAAPIAK